VNAGGFVSTTSFATESGYDTLAVNGTVYSGTPGQYNGGTTLGPFNQAVSSGATVAWESDDSAQRQGWRLCYSAEAAPTPATEMYATHNNIEGSSHDNSALTALMVIMLVGIAIGVAAIVVYKSRGSNDVIQLSEQVVLPTMEPGVGSAYGTVQQDTPRAMYTSNQLHVDVL